MPSGKSARRLLPFFKTTDAPKISEYTELLANALDNDAQTFQGTLAERPAASLRGRLYMVQSDPTAVNNGVLWWDTGTTWIITAEPRREEKYEVKTYARAALEAGVEFSATRDALVTTKAGTIEGTIGGVAAPQISALGQTRVPAGQKLKGIPSEASIEVYVLLI